MRGLFAPFAERFFAQYTWPLVGIFGTLAVSGVTSAQVINYEGTAFPEDFGWYFPAGSPQGERRIEDGWLIESLPNPAQDYYRYDIGGITSLVGRFFVEWRAITDNPEWLIDEFQVPTVVSAAGRAGVLYHTVMTQSAAVLYRDINIPWVVVPFSISEPHTYRVEVFANMYIWYIDGTVFDSGVPEGSYPDPNAFVIWGDEVTYEGAPPATTAWDYVRLGRIPDDASGDYDSDGALTLFDLYFFNDCLTKDGPGIFGGPGNNAGPGCRFADFDSDADTDLADFANFQNVFDSLHP